MRRLMMPSVGRCQHQQLSDAAGGRQNGQFENSLAVLTKCNTYPPYNPAHPFLGIYS